MSYAATDERFFGVLSSILNVRRESLAPASSRETVEEWDSVKHIYLMLALEEEFDIQFTDDEIVNLSDASALIAAIAAKPHSMRPQARLA